MRFFDGWEDLAGAELAHRIPDRGYAITYGISSDLTPPHWMPEFIAFHEQTASGKTTREKRVCMEAWCEQHCAGRHRHLFAGVFEFECRKDMEQFAAVFAE